MKNSTLSWILSLFIAIMLVAVVRHYLLSFNTISDNNMQPTLAAGETGIYLKLRTSKRDALVLFQPDILKDSLLVKRQVAIPGDTIKIRNSIIYINSGRMKDEAEISYTYTFRTDSIYLISNYLIDNGLYFDFTKTYLGIFSCNTSLSGLKILKANPYIFDVKREFEEPYVTVMKQRTFYSAFYWNKDNMGPIIAPKKGMKIKMSRRAFFLYKKLIENESGKRLELRNTSCYLDNEIAGFYTFKQNYYFLLNDNRDKSNDSRDFGFIPENKIVGTYISKLPW